MDQSELVGSLQCLDLRSCFLEFPRDGRGAMMMQCGVRSFVARCRPAKPRMVERTERVFDQMDCDAEERFDYTVSLLQGPAYQWWKTVLGSTTRPCLLSWEDFLRAFRDNYMAKVYLEMKMQEFLELKQGTMTVAEYEVKFNELMGYATVFISTEADRCRRFEGGLNLEIHTRLARSDMGTFVELRAAAVRVEQLLRQSQDETGQGSRGGSRQSGFGQRGRFVQTSSGSGRGSGQVPLVCVCCEKRHSGECWRMTGACLAYGSMDHQIKDCPVTVGAQSAMSGRSGSNTTVQQSRGGEPGLRGRVSFKTRITSIRAL
ncbi:hypothetical protein K2173_018005 [Erythroxylum novogranatense]|uniref:Retrotransposon gag domain-containing protein n=1 Tax=Erythroxylum novogranatense TaxID=1862640 RepID=A0AAV8TWW3_9ROSI|nr:hypothetical protein K2173_018005 [Erythroxylum novogranatense]